MDPYQNEDFTMDKKFFFFLIAYVLSMLGVFQ